MKRVLSILLCRCMLGSLSVCFASCGAKQLDLNGYTAVLDSSVSATSTDLFRSAIDTIKKKTDAEIKIVKATAGDALAEESKYEILIGDTNRPESAKALKAVKGHGYVIKTVGKKLVIAGDTSDTDEYVAMLKRKAEGNPNILFTGFVSGDLLTELYSNAYLVALPSDIEGMSLSLLEALAYGNAVLCSDIPENTLVTEDKAIHFRKSDVDDLTEKLQMMCNDAAFVNEFKRSVDEFILSKYNWNTIADETRELYRSVAKK